MENTPIPAIENRIFTIRGRQVMFDRDLAKLFDVQAKAMNQAVKRNAKRFPEEFMFQLDAQEFTEWKSQIVTSNHFSMREPPFPERAMLLKLLVRYGVAPLVPENETGEGISPVIIQVNPDL